jgi:hypothetical protein
LDTYFIIKNNNEKNEKYENDNIYHCILTMDSSDVIIFKLDLSKSGDIVKNFIINMLQTMNRNNKHIENLLKKRENIDSLLCSFGKNTKIYRSILKRT